MWLQDNLWQLAIPVALILFLYRHAFVKLVEDWVNDPNYTHGFVVPLASIWIVWSMRRTLARTEVEPKTWGLLVIAFALLQLLAGTLGAENFVANSSLLVLLAGLTISIFGMCMLRHLLFPIAWLIFMIPLPAIIFYSITFPLQLLASRMASGLLDVLRITNLREGNVMYFSHYTIGVVEACSGIRSLSAAELFDPVAGTISPTANLIGLRSEHTATLLNTGQVLITGGLDANSNYLATAELYHSPKRRPRPALSPRNLNLTRQKHGGSVSNANQLGLRF